MVSEKFLETARKPKGRDITGERFVRLNRLNRYGKKKITVHTEKGKNDEEGT